MHLCPFGYAFVLLCISQHAITLVHSNPKISTNLKSKMHCIYYPNAPGCNGTQVRGPVSAPCNGSTTELTSTTLEAVTVVGTITINATNTITTTSTAQTWARNESDSDLPHYCDYFPLEANCSKKYVIDWKPFAHSKVYKSYTNEVNWTTTFSITSYLIKLCIPFVCLIWKDTNKLLRNISF